jgi:hypothetical protein
VYVQIGQIGGYPPETLLNRFRIKHQNMSHLIRLKLPMYQQKANTKLPKTKRSGIFDNINKIQLSPEWISASDACDTTASKAAAVVHLHPFLSWQTYTVHKALNIPLPKASDWVEKNILQPALEDELLCKRCLLRHPEILRRCLSHIDIDPNEEPHHLCDTGLWICDRDLNYPSITVGASPDALVVNTDTNEVVAVVEIKCPKSQIYTGITDMFEADKMCIEDYQKEIIPQYQYIQTQLQMDACKVDHCFYICFQAGSKVAMRIIYIPKRQCILDYLFQAITQWKNGLAKVDTQILNTRARNGKLAEQRRVGFVTKEDVPVDKFIYEQNYTIEPILTIINVPN